MTKKKRTSKTRGKAPEPASNSPLTGLLRLRFACNYLSTLLFIGLTYWVVTDVSGFHERMLNGAWRLDALGIDYTLKIDTLLIALFVLYAVILIPYYLRYPWVHSSAWVFMRGFVMGAGRNNEYRPWRTRSLSAPGPLPLQAWLSPMTKQAGLALLLKFFFAPLMINWCLAHLGDMANALSQMVASIDAGRSGRLLFDNGLFWACFQLILFVDTLLFTLGYIVELPALKNRIISVDPTFLGWFVALACYPPFNAMTGQWLPWQSRDFPAFQSDFAHFAANITLLVALAIFSWASIALGFKASNLTNRGIVVNGPYAYVRHPAYAAKNFAWWIGAIPTLYLAFSHGSQTGAHALFAICGWTFIYVMRAITEERHLLVANNGYAEYMRKVKYRFIPGII